MTNLFLTFVLGALAVFGVICDVRTFTLTKEFRALSVQAAMANNKLLQVQSLAADVSAYNQKTPSPELTKILQAAETKPVAH